jgi:formylglycine-generating enzyme required for sulfatase activity
MGTDMPVHQGDGEESFTTFVDPYQISVTAVSNAEFAAFVTTTSYVTDAERFGWSYVFHSLLPETSGPFQAVVDAEWWKVVPGTTWAAPEGPGSDLEGRWDHPVVHVSWNDAAKYCEWNQARLPTEAEFEFAAQNNAPTTFPWGDDLEPQGRHLANVFQGDFPLHNTAADGYLSTAPVDSFALQGRGLHNAIGNVWEWSSEWFDPQVRSATTAEDKLKKGGSYLCHHSYCGRYRAAARMGSTPDSSAGNVGFRIARSV